MAGAEHCKENPSSVPFGCTTALPYFCCCVVASKCAMLGRAACKHLWEAADSDTTGVPCLFLRSVSSGNGVDQMLLAAGHSWPHSWAALRASSL